MSHPFIQAFVEVNIMDVKKLPATDVLHAQDLGQGPLIFVVLVPPQHGQAAALDYLPLGRQRGARVGYWGASGSTHLPWLPPPRPEHLVTLKDLYIKNSDGFVVLYSVCSEASFEAVRPLRERMGRLRGPKAVPLVLVGTKADLDAQRQVLTAQGRALAREWRCPFLEVTAKSKLMVDQVFTQVVREMEALAPPEEEAPVVPANVQETWPSERFIG